MLNAARSIFRAAFLFAVVIGISLPVQAASLSDEVIGKYRQEVLFGTRAQRTEALRQLVARENPDVVPALIPAIRYAGGAPELNNAFSQLVGSDATDWFDAMLWQERHPEFPAHPR